MNLEIEKLPWDSSLFNLSIGKIELPSGNEIDIPALEKNSNTFDLIYLLSADPVNLLSERIKPVDIKIRYRKVLQSHVHAAKWVCFDSLTFDYNDLLSLAYLSGNYSRFKMDLNFQRGAFEKLYKRWLDKSIESEDEKVIVISRDDNICGFVTVDLRHNSMAKIGLLAVHPSCQGRGIGSELLDQVESIAKSSGKESIEVATQLANKPAIALYEKNGYKIYDKKFIYHFWNK